MEREKWEDIYTKEELHSIQLIEKNILIEFINVCRKLNIEYFIYGGTLLGLIKYGDMIPWDDDIDVAMTRENYIRFLKEAPSILSAKYVIQSPYNEKNSPFSYTKMRRVGTMYIEEYNHNLNIEKGIYIDIYPVDNIPDDEKLRIKQWKKARFFCKLYYFRQCIHANKEENYFKYLKHAIVYRLLRIIPQSFYIAKIDYYMTLYNSDNHKRKACLFSPNLDNIYINLYPLLKRKFGDIDVMIPNCYDDHLKRRYGNYEMNLPYDKRIGHVPYKFSIPKEILEGEKYESYKRRNG